MVIDSKKLNKLFPVFRLGGRTYIRLFGKRHCLAWGGFNYEHELAFTVYWDRAPKLNLSIRSLEFWGEK